MAEAPTYLPSLPSPVHSSPPSERTQLGVEPKKRSMRLPVHVTSPVYRVPLNRFVLRWTAHAWA